jgi:hypothetical protein
MRKKKMMASFLLMLAVVLVPARIVAQRTINDVFNGKELVYFGMDFTRARFIGTPEQSFDIKPGNELEIVTKYIPEWNALVAREPERFDLKNAFGKPTIYYDLQPVTKKNAEITPTGIMDLNPTSISDIQMEAMVSSYEEGEKKDGLGLVFIVENFDKPNQLATYYVTFFDVYSRKIILCEKVTGAPSGIGIRNYWAGSLKRVLAEF